MKHGVVRNFRQWHWLVIGLVVGVSLGGLSVATGPAYRDSTARTLSQPLFERGITASPRAGFRLDHLVIHPSDESGATWITGICHESTGPGETRDGEFKFRASTPYQPRLAVDIPDPATFTVADYLDQIAARVPQAALTYRYAWYERPILALLAWTIGTMVLAGLFGRVIRRRGVDETEADRMRGTTGAQKSTASPNADQVDPVDTDAEVAAYVDALASDAASTTIAGGSGVVAVGEAPIRKLSPMPAAHSPKPEPKEEKEYRGEYYPTIAHSKKPADAGEP